MYLSLDNGSRAFTALAWELFCKYVNRIHGEINDGNNFSKYFIANNLTLGVYTDPDANNNLSIAVKAELHVDKDVNNNNINDVISTYHEKLVRTGNHKQLLNNNSSDGDLPNTRAYRSLNNDKVDDVLNDSDFDDDKGLKYLSDNQPNLNNPGNNQPPNPNNPTTVVRKTILTDRYKIKSIKDFQRPVYDKISKEYNKVFNLNDNAINNYISEIVGKIKKL